MTATASRALLPALGVGVLGLAAAVWLWWTPAPSRPASPDPLVVAAKPLAVGEVANFILYDVPEPAPEIAFTDERGTARTLRDFRGQAILVNFWATWCGPCKKEMPSLDRLQAALGSDRFQVLPVSQDKIAVDKVRAFYTQQTIADLPLYIDQTGTSQRAFAVTGLPATVLIDGEGRVVGRMVGPAEWDSPEAQALLKHFAAR
jgi:thiol-disulfide isomerase/thioredoxin